VLPLLVVAAVAFVTFLPALDAGFVSWDDDSNLVDNPDFRGLGRAQLRWMFTTTLLGHYIPLTWLSFGVNYWLGGMAPWGYHLGNLLLHAANAGLFYLVSRRLLEAAFGGGVRDAGPRVEVDHALTLGAAFAALAFAVHPLRVESVAWVTERRDVLCGVFYLLTALAYLRGVAGGGVLRGRWQALSLGAFVLALLSKAAAMPLPAALLIADVYPLRRVATVGWRRLLIEKLPYLLLAGAAAALALIAQQSARAVSGYAQYGWGARVGMTGYSLMFYPWAFLWPADLSPLYELPQRVDPLRWRFLLPTVGFALVSAALVAARRRFPWALAAWAYSAVLVLPVTGAVVHAGVQLVSDRYTYLSGLSFALLAGGALTWLLRERRRVKPVVAAACFLAALLLVVGWAAGAWRQTRIWRDSETLWRYAREVDPDCALCNLNLGAELISPPTGPARAREAEWLFGRVIALRPDRLFAYHGLGIALAMQGRDTEAEAAFRLYTERDPAAPTPVVDLGVLRLSRRRAAEAIALFRRAQTLDPQFPGLARDLGRALRERALQLQSEGRELEADALLREAQGLGAETPAPGQWLTTAAPR
jgi:protein O-mannosyl-transferase